MRFRRRSDNVVDNLGTLTNREFRIYRLGLAQGSADGNRDVGRCTLPVHFGTLLPDRPTAIACAACVREMQGAADA